MAGLKSRGRSVLQATLLQQQRQKLTLPHVCARAVPPGGHQHARSGEGVEPILSEACSAALPRSAICVQKFDDSLNSAIRITYRISLRSSSVREPRYPLLRVVQRFRIVVFFFCSLWQGGPKPTRPARRKKKKMCSFSSSSRERQNRIKGVNNGISRGSPASDESDASNPGRIVSRVG